MFFFSYNPQSIASLNSSHYFVPTMGIRPFWSFRRKEKFWESALSSSNVRFILDPSPAHHHVILLTKPFNLVFVVDTQNK